MPGQAQRGAAWPELTEYSASQGRRRAKSWRCSDGNGAARRIRFRAGRRYGDVEFPGSSWSASRAPRPRGCGGSRLCSARVSG